MAESRPIISLGMSLSEVLTLRGKPLEKTEYESLRTERWIYADGSIVFRAGRVALMDSALGSRAEPKVESDVQVHKEHGDDSPSSTNMFTLQQRDRSKEMKGVLDEILKAIPSEDSPRSPGSSAPPSIGGVPPVEILKQ